MGPVGEDLLFGHIRRLHFQLFHQFEDIEVRFGAAAARGSTPPPCRMLSHCTVVSAAVAP
jgi:hypothetical protein